MTTPHQTIPVQVWADIDIGVADLVKYLNTIPGVRTYASCQGTIGEGGPEPYGPQVTVSWEDSDVLARLRAEFNVQIIWHGSNSGYVEPRAGWTAPAPQERVKFTLKELTESHLRAQAALADRILGDQRIGMSAAPQEREEMADGEVAGPLREPEQPRETYNNPILSWPPTALPGDEELIERIRKEMRVRCADGPYDHCIDIFEAAVKSCPIIHTTASPEDEELIRRARNWKSPGGEWLGVTQLMYDLSDRLRALADENAALTNAFSYLARELTARGLCNLTDEKMLVAEFDALRATNASLENKCEVLENERHVASVAFENAQLTIAEKDAEIARLKETLKATDLQREDFHYEAKRLREALRPFANPPLYVFDYADDHQFIPEKMGDGWIGGGWFTTGDFKRARRALPENENV